MNQPFKLYYYYYLIFCMSFSKNEGLVKIIVNYIIKEKHYVDTVEMNLLYYDHIVDIEYLYYGQYYSTERVLSFLFIS
jgi:hypothetical protein